MPNKGVVYACRHCDSYLGSFKPCDDNGGVIVRCERCKKGNRISNQALSYPDEYGSYDRVLGRFVIKGEEPD